MKRKKDVKIKDPTSSPSTEGRRHRSSKDIKTQYYKHFLDSQSRIG